MSFCQLGENLHNRKNVFLLKRLRNRPNPDNSKRMFYDGEHKKDTVNLVKDYVKYEHFPVVPFVNGCGARQTDI